MSMQASGSGRSGPEDFERELRSSLYRFDCPDAHTLGEYQIGVLDPQESMRIGGHAAQCDECQADLRLLRQFLAEPIEVPETLGERARRIVATLFRPAPGLAYSGVRGAPDSATQVYQAGNVTITLSDSLMGLVVFPGHSAHELEGRSVKLIPGEGAPIVTEIDDLGNFEVNAKPGVYELEIDMPEGVIVIERLQVG